ncbi:uncharacterized protein LOC122872197 [Siniperca chuatsi]|uniref:uncharacterized protein LOC122872197 n=1 Tax=Siniperca chuatsi TaxID=119488 RepID=UPI001CE10BBF|nr:uncharacterized protein LOC122872197 [Siniperca chuatsi]
MSTSDPVQELLEILRRGLIASSPSTSTSDASASAPVTPAVPPCPSPMAKPAPFSGLAEDCNGFILQCSLVLEMQSSLYPTERSKVAFVISQLQGRALQWAESIWSQDGSVTQSLMSFLEHFREVFGRPAGDSSAGEKLYQLKQGQRSIQDYALEFRTLAAASGWNEQSLITTFHQGLEPRVRLHLAAYEDTIGLERFIQLAIWVATRMQTCFSEHQDQPSLTRNLRQPEKLRPPEPEPEPMQLDSYRLTSTERQRRLTRGLCLYCGASGHNRATCPVRPPRPMVSVILPSLPCSKPLSTEITLVTQNFSIPVQALIDSGSAGNFISGSLCRQLGIKTFITPTSYQVRAIPGKAISRRGIQRATYAVTIRVGLLHEEQQHLMVLEGSTAEVILGRPWLEQHDPIISWATGEVLKWGKSCFPGCFPRRPKPSSSHLHRLHLCTTSIESPREKQSVEIPPCYAAYKDANGTLSLLRERFWWPSMARDVRRYVQGCTECAMSKSPRHLPAGKLCPLATPNRPWSHLGVDFITDLPPSDNNTCVLVAVDRFSKSCRLIPLRGLPTAMETAKCIFNHVFRYYGLPEDIVSDRGPQFISRFWKAFFSLLGVTVSLSSGYHPQSNGQTERKIQDIGRFLRTFCHDHQDSWNQFLGWAEYAQNSLRQPSTGLTPFQCVLGYQPPLFPWSGEPLEVPAVDHWFRESERVWDAAHHQLRRALCRRRLTANHRRSTTPRYLPGQKVWLSTRDIRMRLPCRKLSPRFIGPFTIIEQINPVTYKLQLPAQYKIHPTFHVSLLKPFYPSVPVSTEPGETTDTPLPLLLEDGTAYQVREILDSRRRGGLLEYLVDWEGYGPEERSWVPRHDILDPSLLTEFHADHPDRPAPRGRGRPPRRRGPRSSGADREGGGTVTDTPGSTSSQPHRTPSPEY